MQPNEITLTVDVANDGDTTADETQVYTRFDVYQNRSVYVGENHAVASPHTLSLYRTAPKPSGNFPGMAKSAFKISETVGVLANDGISTIKAPNIIEISISAPVGTTTDALKENRQRAIALLDNDEIMDDLSFTLMV